MAKAKVVKMQDKTWFNDWANRAKFRATVVAIATAEIGYQEQRGNNTKYGAELHMNGVSWCAIFASWCYVQAAKQLGVPNPLAGLQTPFGYAHVTTAYDSAVRKRLVVPANDPSPLLPGDLAFWDHDGIPYGPGHTGIWTPKGIIEGNTNQRFSRTGGMVAIHTHVQPDDGKHGRLLGIVRPTRAFAKAA